MFKNITITCFMCLALSGCFADPGVVGNLGAGEDRRVVIVGENVSPEIAVYYQRRYDAKVWFTPSQGEMKDTRDEILNNLRPSTAMRSLINELKSIDHSLGRWEIIVPGVAERYFLMTLKFMDTDSLAHARGDVVLTDSRSNKDIEAQLNRVSDGGFFVTYEFQKY